MSTQRERLLSKASRVLGTAAGTGLLALALSATPSLAQNAVSDSQLQANVTAALHNDALLTGTGVNVSTAQGVVTLTGDVANEDVRTEAEQAAAGVSGVKSIQDNINVGGAPAGESAATVAQAAPQDQTNNTPPASPQSNAGMPPPPPLDQPAAQQPAQQPGQGSEPQYTPYPNNGGAQPQYPAQANGQYPNQPGGYAPGGYPEDGGYGPRGNARPPQPANTFGVSPQQQNSSGPVTIPPGTLLSVRTTQPLSTGSLKGGEYFQLTAAADVYANGVVAIPRGAVLTGQVVEAKNAGAFGGSPLLNLKLTSIQLGPTTYPVASEMWSSKGPSKSGYTAANTVGGAAVGALIGAVAGGGLGAGIGAVAGGASGAVISGATHGPRLDLPAEALLQFHISGPLTVQPVHFDEAQRLAASVPEHPVLRQRPVYVAAPYPYPYGPRPYPYYPYGYPYPY